MKRILVLSAALLLVFGGFAAIASTPAVAQTAANNTTADDVPDRYDAGGQYDYATLASGGVTQNVDNVPSVRALGSPPKGFAAARYRDPTLLDEITGSPGKWKQIGSDGPVQVNELQVYGSAFGETAGEYTLVVVHWQSVSPPNTTGQVAVNQSVYRHDIAFAEEDLYSYHNVSLAKHIQSPYETTMWLERNGEKVDGAQWRFTHLSNPSTSGTTVTSEAGLWGFSLRNVILPALVAIPAGFIGGRRAVKEAAKGPGFGIGSWLLLLGLVGTIIATVAYYQIAVILSNFPYVMGLSFGVLAFGLALTVHQPEKRVGFLRRELADAELIPGGPPQRPATDGGAIEADVSDIFGKDDAGAEAFDELTEALFVDLPEVPAVRTDDGYRVPVKGLRPFFARWFAKAAKLDVSNIATRTRVKDGRLDDIVFVDPDYDETLIHKPARMVRVLPWDTLDEGADTVEKLMAGAMTAAIVVGPGAVGYTVAGGALNIPWVGAIAGALVTVVIAYSAEDGWIEFEAAPAMYERAEHTMTSLQVAHKEAKESKSDREEKWEERAKTRREAREEMDDEVSTISQEFLQSFGAANVVTDNEEESEIAKRVDSETDTPAFDEEEDGAGEGR